MASKIGEGHLAGMARMGLNEVRSALYPESNVAQQQPEVGIFGRLTQGEIAEARSPDDRTLDEERTPRPDSVLANRPSSIDTRDLYGRDDKEQDLDK